MLGLASATCGALGALGAFAMSHLPAERWSLATLTGALMALFFAPRARPLAAFACALAWTCLCGSWAMAQRLPPELAGRDLDVVIEVTGLPKRNAASLRFDARIVSSDDAPALTGRNVRLGWYGDAPGLDPGSRWAIGVRLKRPRGTVNPGGFDFERHALERGIDATGYVRANRCEHADTSRHCSVQGKGVDALRARLSLAIARSTGPRDARFVQALALGDTRGLDDHDWDVLRATGISHLIAISGLHVGLVAGFGALAVAGAYRVFPRVGLRLPLPQGAALGALIAASAYTALAGFALPTVRTLLMIAAALLGAFLRRAVSASQAFALSLIAMLAADPLALLGAGFWLSFLGVAWLLWCLPRAAAQPAWRSLLTAQGVMTVSLLPLTVWFFGQASLVGPPANLVAVPWVSFVVVPVALVGVGVELLVGGAGSALFVAAAWLMECLWRPLQGAAEWHGAIAWLPEPSVASFLLASLGAFWLLLPRGLPGKPLAVLLFLPLVVPKGTDLRDGEADVTLLDVGQGLSVLVRTRTHALLYDAGPAFDGGLDQGEAAVVPALHALGVERLDRYVESHGHNDHAGGTEAVLRAFPGTPVLASARPERCEAGQRWLWDDVRFDLLHRPRDFPYLENDSSCVLRVETRGGTLLLPGDISEAIEQRLVRDMPAKLDAELLVVPHHGSRTSSSRAFVRAVSPTLALIGSGHGNRFGLPRADIVRRYAAAGATVLQSADRGAISIRLSRSGPGPPRALRDGRHRWWRED